MRETKAHYYSGSKAISDGGAPLKSHLGNAGGVGADLDYDEKGEYLRLLCTNNVVERSTEDRASGRELNIGTGLLRKINKHPRRDLYWSWWKRLCLSTVDGGENSSTSGQHWHRSPKVSLALQPLLACLVLDPYSHCPTNPLSFIQTILDPFPAKWLSSWTKIFSDLVTRVEGGMLSFGRTGKA